MQIRRMLLSALLLAGLSSGASAQSATADLPINRGGVGIGRHGTGFDGTYGDPDLFPASPATLARLGYAPPYRMPGTEYGTPGSVGYGYTPAPQGPAMQYEFVPRSAR